MTNGVLFDYVVLGGGIVGVSTALSLKTKYPEKRVLLLEKEDSFAQHQTGHNSGVIHAGVYYETGSLKAEFCREGLKDTIAFCNIHGIPFEQCGKLLVATNALELERMDKLFERCKANQIEVEILDQEELHKIEPNIAGIGAILVKSTGIVDYKLITKKMIEEFESIGGEFLLNTKVVNLEESKDQIKIITSNEQIFSKYLICCAGLMADRVARLLDIKINFQIIPFRGEYYRLKKPVSYTHLRAHET